MPAITVSTSLISHVRGFVTERVLREARDGEQVEAIVSGIALPSPDELTASVTDWIEDHEAEAWSDGVSDLVQEYRPRRAAIASAPARSRLVEEALRAKRSD